MVLTQIQLEVRQAEMLKQIAAERELSVAELIRRNRYLSGLDPTQSETRGPQGACYPSSRTVSFRCAGLGRKPRPLSAGGIRRMSVFGATSALPPLRDPDDAGQGVFRVRSSPRNAAGERMATPSRCAVGKWRVFPVMR